MLQRRSRLFKSRSLVDESIPRERHGPPRETGPEDPQGCCRESETSVDQPEKSGRPLRRHMGRVHRDMSRQPGDPGSVRPSEVKGPGPDKTQRGQSPEGQVKTQCGQRPEGQTRPSVVRALRVCEEQTRTCATARRPECQQASVPPNPTFPCLFSQAAGVTFQLPWEGRRACLSVLCSLLLFSLLSFSVLVSREFS